jgi:hypothetical protein
MKNQLMLALGATALLTSAASADFVNYGDFVGSTFQFLGVTEESGTDPLPLYNAPILVGSSLQFNDMDFGSSAADGSSDITDGQINLQICSEPGTPITDIMFDEEGDYTLSGLSGEAFAAVGATVFIEILELDGSPVPFAVDATFGSSFFGFTSDGDFYLSEEGISTAELWDGGITVDINAIIANAGLSGSATKVNVTINNVLQTSSVLGTAAAIRKKDAGLSITVIPAPATLALLGMAGVCGRRRRR